MKKITSTNPARNYDILGEVTISTPDEITTSVQSARAAQPAWQKLGVAGRVAKLQKLADIFQDNKTELIRRASEEMGAPIELSARLAAGAEENFSWCLSNAEEALTPQKVFEDENEVNEIWFEPYGVVACIVAWNFPYPNFSHNALQPLLAGNTIVFKYSEEVPLFSKFLESLVLQADLPEGVINFVYGDGAVGEQLARSEVDFISFTGSYAVGQKLYNIAAEKFIPILNELGGSSPGIVFDDCDLDQAIPDIFWARFLNSAQFCDGLKRLIVHESIFDECVTKLAEYAKNRTIGDPLNKTTELGPLVAERQVVKLETQLADARSKGAKVVCGGQRPQGLQGAYFEPTILTNIKPDMAVWREEVFGPVLPVVPFSTYEEAIQLANDTIYGLSGFVFTADKNRSLNILKDLKAGAVSTHGSHYYRAVNPFGGYKKSGLGRTGGIAGFQQSTQLKTVSYTK